MLLSSESIRKIKKPKIIDDSILQHTQLKINVKIKLTDPEAMVIIFWYASLAFMAMLGSIGL